MVETHYMPTRKRAPKNLGRVLVLGLGKSGLAVSEYLANLLGSRVESLSIAAGKSTPSAQEFAQSMRARGVRVEFDHEDIQETYDLCVVSPGISQFGAFYQSAQAACAEIISEPEFAWRESAADSRWIAITGTNGKTTTVALTEHLLKQAGFAAKAVGNIGDTCIQAVASDAIDTYVAEVSSYQLASTSCFAPDAAVLLNITPDHLKWHGSMDEYVAAKRKILANLDRAANAVAVLDATNDIVRETVRELKAVPDEQRGFSYVALGTAEGIRGDMRARCGAANAAFLSDDDMLTVALNGKEIELINANDLLIEGEHNVSNALAASAAALAVGADPASVSRGLATFAALEHRIEPCGSIDGVACYNDSKATNVDATLKAFAAFGERKPIVLLGGRDKGTDLDPLVQAANQHAKAVVCYGESRERFLEAFASAQVVVLSAEKTEDALDAALGIAQPGDIVLLSPACASFDEFSCFEERGDVFKALVAARIEAAGKRAAL